MSKETDLLRRAADILAALADPGRAVCGSISDISSDAASLLALADQMERAEPVAWMRESKVPLNYTEPAVYDTRRVVSLNRRDGDVPLYTHPAPEVTRDAERYRFLVSSPEYAMSKAIQDLWQKTNGIYPTAEQWGAAIDAAMQEPKP